MFPNTNRAASRRLSGANSSIRLRQEATADLREGLTQAPLSAEASA
jgi:hypothetical protein